MRDILEIIKDVAIQYGLKAILFIVLLLVGLKAIKIISNKVDKILHKKAVDITIVKFTSSMLRIALKILLVVVLLSTFDIGVTSFVAILGAASFAVGLALQGSLANFAAGVILLILRPFKVGDFVEVNGLMGTVSTIEIFSTILKTPDNKTIIIPNGSIVGSNIVNYSIEAERRVDFLFGVDYSADIKQVKGLLESIAKKHPMVLDTPDTFVGLKDLSDSSIDFVLRVWVKSEDYWTVYFEIMEEVKEALDAENISIPYPHVQVVQS